MQPDPRRPCEEGGSSLGLGELAQLTVNNDAEAAYDVSWKKNSSTSSLNFCTFLRVALEQENFS